MKQKKIVTIRNIEDKEGSNIVKEDSILKIWKEYFKKTVRRKGSKQKENGTRREWKEQTANKSK